MSAANDMPASIVDAQVQRLLEIVNGYQQEQCSALLKQAEQQSQLIMRQAYHNARLRLHHDIQESRLHMQQQLSATRAKLHTLIMQQRHRADQEFLARSWELLTSKLLQRWQKPENRMLWLENIIATALKALPGGQWELAHPVDWTDADQKIITSLVGDDEQRQLTFTSDESITAGMRISAAGAVVDGTLQGLMADRSRIESEVLAQCRDCIVQRYDNP